MIGRTIAIMRVSVLLKMIGAVALVALADCGKRPMIRPEVMLAPECEILAGPAEFADTVRVALLDAVRPEHAPWARNASEQLLFRHLYETLITVDCLGEVQAGLAKSWNSGEGDRRWTFVLREGAEFWDGTPVTVRDVARSWQHTVFEPMTQGAGIDSVTVVGDRTLHVYLTRPHRRIPRALSAPAFAVAKSSEDSHWPLGSGPYRVAPWERRSTGMSRRTITTHPAFGMDGPVIKFVEASMYDARDLLEGVIDVMVTADPAVIEYAASRPHLSTIALPWDITYVLLSISRVEKLRWGSTLGTFPSDLSDRLARDAVRGAARGYRPPSWWDDLSRCSDLFAAVPLFPSVPRFVYSSSGLRRILYDVNDPIARDLAERIVALAATDPFVSPEAAAIASAVPGLISDTAGIGAEGLTRSELDLSLRYGDDFAYVVPIPRRPPDPCYEARSMVNRARWLSTFKVDFSKALIPLVDTRLHVIVNSSKVGLIVDWYGNILIANEMLQVR
jgi:hypothetical protein